MKKENINQKKVGYKKNTYELRNFVIDMVKLYDRLSEIEPTKYLEAYNVIKEIQRICVNRGRY